MVERWKGGKTEGKKEETNEGTKKKKMETKKRMEGEKTEKRWEERLERDERKDKCEESTVGQNNQKYRLKYWATRSSVCPHCSLLRLLAHFAHSLARGTVID